MRDELKTWYDQAIRWRDGNVWPWTVYTEKRLWHDRWISKNIEFDRAKDDIEELHKDIGVMGKWAARNGIRLTNYEPNGRHPVAIAYSTGAIKMVQPVKLGDGKVTSPDIEYIYSNPMVIGFRPDWPLDMSNPRARAAVRAELVEYISAQIIEDTTKLVGRLTFE